MDLNVFMILCDLDEVLMSLPFSGFVFATLRSVDEIVLPQLYIPVNIFSHFFYLFRYFLANIRHFDPILMIFFITNIANLQF